MCSQDANIRNTQLACWLIICAYRYACIYIYIYVIMMLSPTNMEV